MSNDLPAEFSCCRDCPQHYEQFPDWWSCRLEYKYFDPDQGCEWIRKSYQQVRDEQTDL